jgi:hypothetical protein
VVPGTAHEVLDPIEASEGIASTGEGDADGTAVDGSVTLS